MADGFSPTAKQQAASVRILGDSAQLTTALARRATKACARFTKKTAAVQRPRLAAGLPLRWLYCREAVPHKAKSHAVEWIYPLRLSSYFYISC